MRISAMCGRLIVTTRLQIWDNTTATNQGSHQHAAFTEPPSKSMQFHLLTGMWNILVNCFEVDSRFLAAWNQGTDSFWNQFPVLIT